MRTIKSDPLGFLIALGALVVFLTAIALEPTLRNNDPLAYILTYVVIGEALGLSILAMYAFGVRTGGVTPTVTPTT